MRIQLALVCWITLTSSVVAQNPFGDGGDPFGGTGTMDSQAGANPFGASGNSADPFSGGAANQTDTGFSAFGQAGGGQAKPADDAALEEEKDPVVRLLRAKNPQTPAEVAQGMVWMIRIKRWDEVARLLDQIQASNWDLNSQAALARSVGTSMLLRARAAEAEWTEAQQQTISTLMSAPAKLARAPQNVDRWIQQLGDPSPGSRRLAQMRLQDAGTVAVQRIVGRLLDGGSGVPAEMLAGTALLFGRDGEDALHAACLVADPARAANVYMALADLPGNDFSLELGVALVGGVLNEQQQSIVAEKLSGRYGELPTLEAVKKFVERRFEAEMQAYQRARQASDTLPDLVWTVTQDGAGIEAGERPAEDLPLERLAQISRHRAVIHAADVSRQVEAAAIEMQRRYQQAPNAPREGAADLNVASIDNAAASTADFWQQVFNQASQWQMHGGAINALQQLASAGKLEQSMFDFLGDLLTDSRPVIRFSALEAIATADPQFAYRGAEHAVETALEMSRLDSGPHALVVGLQSERRQVAQQQIQLQTGASVTSVNSARAALRALESQEPIELIFVVDRVADQSIFELLQRLRNSRNGGALPIAVLTDELYSHERDLISRAPGMVASVLSRNPDQMNRVLDLQLQMLDTEPLSMSDRNHYAMVAGQFLAKISSNQQRYAFYALGDWREHLVSAAGTLSSSSQTELLSGVGTPESQAELVNLAGVRGGDEVERKAAANGFAQSVRQFGLRMSKQQVLASYDLYNKMAGEDPVAAKTLGFVLDVMEAQAGQRAWPEGL